ncbi:MAG TPA: hypothetical protein VFV28_03250 [Limnobacter sp.]|nr:hypothetical protein [Limnobacter sp.]
MDDFFDSLPAVNLPDEAGSRREWFVGVLGAGFCYGLIIWLL